MTGAKIDVQEYPQFGLIHSGLQWYIYSDNGGIPGQIIAFGYGSNHVATYVGTDPSSSSNFYEVRFDFGQNISLNASTKYWFGLSLGGLVPLTWSTTVVYGYEPAVNEGFGGGWTNLAFPSRNLEFELQGTSVPEPLTHLDVTPINQADSAYIWYDSSNKARLAGCVPASLAMMIDYTARTYGGINGIDFSLVLEQIRNQYLDFYNYPLNRLDSIILSLKKYYRLGAKPTVTNAHVDAAFVASLDGTSYDLDIGNNLYAQIDWNPYFNSATAYNETLHNIKESINYGNPVGIGVWVLENTRKMNRSADEWVLGKTADKDWGGHMMVITGYDVDPSCTDNPDNICSFTVNDTWFNTAHRITPHRYTDGTKHGIAFTHDVDQRIQVLVPGDTNNYPLIITESITIIPYL